MNAFAKRIVIAVITYEATILLRRMKPKIIAVTGSVGKTSMKDAIYGVVKNHFSARKSEKSFNSEIGIPLTILGLPNAWNSPLGWIKNILDGAFIALFTRNYPQLLVIEAGVDRPNDMKHLTKWLTPDIAVITRLPDVPVHVEYFTSPEQVAEEKLILASALRPDGTLIYNHDDIRLQEYVRGVRHNAVGYGRVIPTHVTAGADTVIYDNGLPVGFSCTVTYLEETETVRIMGVIGDPMSYTISGAIAVGLQCGLTLKETAQGIADYQVPPGRMRLIPGIKGTFIIDDTYNSSPTAVEAALTSLRELKHVKRKIAVLGDMLELGKFSPREHERVGEMVPSCADILVTIGIRSQKTAEAALNAGMHEKNILQFEDATKAGRELQNLIKPGDVLLVKGSQGVRAERVVEELMADPTTAASLLVRQDEAWQER